MKMLISIKMNLVPSTLLLLTSCMSRVLATHGPGTVNCCAAWSSTRRHFTQIQSYSIQSEGVCDFASVLFVARDGSRICSDPNSAWSKKVMRKVDEKMKLTTPSAATALREPSRRTMRRSRRRWKGRRASKKRQGN